MIKATSTLIAAVAALALSGGVYAQSAGGSGSGGAGGTGAGGATSGALSHGSTATPTNNQLNNTTGNNSGYGMPGANNSDSGMGNNMSGGQAAPKSNNTLATPSTVSPAGNGQ
jgi:hypothetical protein